MDRIIGFLVEAVSPNKKNNLLKQKHQLNPNKACN